MAFQLPNWREAVVAFYGLAMGGYVLVPIVHIYGPKEVRFILAQSGAVAYLSADRFGHVDYTRRRRRRAGGRPARPAVARRGRSTSPARRPQAWRASVGTWSIVPPRPTRSHPATRTRSASLAYTSGTTSDPKGVIHTHRSLLAEVSHIAGMIAVAHPNLMGSPVTHATGMLGAVLAPMELGEPIHLVDRWDPEHALEIMLEADIGAGTGAAVFLASLLDHPGFTEEHAAKIRRVGLGGAPVPPALGERAASHGIVVIRAYGSTEHPSVTSGSYDDPAAKRHGTDGRPLPGVEIRLLDDDGEPVPVGTAGEIWSRGPDLAFGYTDPDADRPRRSTADGWYRTGDMGVLDDDGFLTITDRLNDVIIRGGENVSAAEIEEAIVTRPDVLEVAVVAAPDERLGEHACAIVRLAPGVDGITLADLTGELDRLGVARQKWPEELRVVDDFPRTASGKIRKVDLRRAAARRCDGRRTDRSGWTRSPGALGAVITGVDLAGDLSEDTVAAIRRAWLEHLVVFFRDQTLPPDAFTRVRRTDRRTGASTPSSRGIEGHPEIIEVAKLPHETVNFGGIWHSDTTYLERPPMGTMLLARQIPPVGGDTLFADMYAAFDGAVAGDAADARRPPRGEHVRARRCVEDPRGPHRGVGGAHADVEYVAEHPVVRTHPETGRKALYVNVAHTARFAGMTEEESRGLLGFLFEHSVRPEFTCRFHWQVGSLALWDNRCAMHNPLNDYHGHTRAHAPHHPRRRHPRLTEFRARSGEPRPLCTSPASAGRSARTSFAGRRRVRTRAPAGTTWARIRYPLTGNALLGPLGCRGGSPRGMPVRSEVSWPTVPAMLRDGARRHPDAEAVVDGERRVTYAALQALVDDAARGLLASGIATGDRVAVWAPNSLEWIVAALGVTRRERSWSR